MRYGLQAILFTILNVEVKVKVKTVENNSQTEYDRNNVNWRITEGEHGLG